MKSFAGLTLGMLLFLLTACPNLSGPSNPATSEIHVSQTIWVAKTYSGGQQCQPTVAYEPPDVERLLEQNGAIVLDVTALRLGVCAACSCPYYAARHYAQIPAQHLPIAEELGFEESERPEGS